MAIGDNTSSDIPHTAAHTAASTLVGTSPDASPSAPSLTLTPATPDQALSSTIAPAIVLVDTHPSFSEATIPSDPTPSGGRASTMSTTAPPAGAAGGSSSAAAPATTTTANHTKPRNTTTGGSGAALSTGPQTQRKRRKRKGFAGLLLALGCLSASEFEDDDKTAAGKTKKPEQMQQKAGAAPATATKTTVEAPSGTKADVKATAGETGPTTSTGAIVAGGAGAAGAAALVATAAAAGEGRAGPASGVASTSAADGTSSQPAVVSGADRDVQPGEELVVAPVEPVKAPIDETAGVLSSAVQPPGSGSELLQTTPQRPSRADSDVAHTSSGDKTETSGGYSNISEDMPESSSGGGVTHAGGAVATDDSEQGGGDGEDADVDGGEYQLDDEYEDEEDRLIAQGGLGIPLDEQGNPAPLLRPIDKDHIGRKCLVLDLDETLLHSSFKMLPTADFIVPVEIESQTHNVYVIKRPGVDQFLLEMGKIYEIVVFTASLSKYADPVLDMLDIHHVVRHRLFRESCYNHKGNYVKDLSQLGREMETIIILDNSPASYIFHPNNAVPVSTWFNDPHDTELTDLCPFLTDLAAVDDIRGVLDGSL